MPSESDSALRTYWPRWVEFLRRHGLEQLAIVILEGGSPLALLGAQAFLFGSPLLRPALSTDTVEGIIDLLEDDESRQSFIDYLREAGRK